jgi:RNase P/RNase MRP subunit p30
MEFTDIVDFDFANPQDYGFSKALRIGRDIFIYTIPDKNPKSPSILAAQDKKSLLHNLRHFDLIYFPSYETDVELITSAVKKGKRFIVALSDILEKQGAERSITLYRIRRFIQFCNTYGAKFVIASFAKSVYGVRTPKEVGAIAHLLGLDPQQAEAAMRKL